MPAKIRTLIVDDEPLGRTRLRGLLKSEADVEIIGECSDGSQAVEFIQANRPDLVFLDVQMPRLDGFGVVRQIGPERMPVTIFCTAFDRYALQAFEVHALDYLLKPFDKERFQGALRYARATIERERDGKLSERLAAILEDVKPKAKPLERLAVRSAGRVLFLKTTDLDWIESAGNYLKLHVGKEHHLLRETMNALEVKLDPEQFIRIHRSIMVNITQIKELQPAFHGDHVVILASGKELPVSRNYRGKLQELLGGDA
jgi:two-component system LytT family response regulator